MEGHYKQNFTVVTGAAPKTVQIAEIMISDVVNQSTRKLSSEKLTWVHNKKIKIALKVCN